MFEQLAAEQVLRAVSRLTAVYRNRFSVFDRRAGSIAVVVLVTGRTAGSVTAVLEGSWGGAYSTLATGSSSGGVIYLFPSGTIPPTLRITVTPSGDFVGNVKVALRSAGLPQNQG